MEDLAAVAVAANTLRHAFSFSLAPCLTHTHPTPPSLQELEAMKARLAAMEKEQAALRGSGEEVSGQGERGD